MLLLAFIGMSCQQQVKTAYVDNLQLYNEFELKKELESDYQQLHAANEASLDSIKRELQALAQYLDGQEQKDPEKVIRFNSVRQEFIDSREAIELTEQQITENYTDQVWLHLNEYVKAFAEEKGYDYVLGGSGQGNVMYAKDGLNVTAELIAYVNRKYQGDES